MSEDKVITQVDKPADVAMTGVEAAKLDRALDLLSAAYRELRSPYKSGPALAQYRAQSARMASGALREAHLLLSGRAPRTIDS